MERERGSMLRMTLDILSWAQTRPEMPTSMILGTRTGRDGASDGANGKARLERRATRTSLP